MTPHRGLPEEDWYKNKRRQLSGILHSPFLNSVANSFTPSSFCFHLEEMNRWLFPYRSEVKKQIPPVPSDSRDL